MFRVVERLTLLIVMAAGCPALRAGSTEGKRRLEHREQEALCRIYQAYHEMSKLLNQLEDTPVFVPGVPWDLACPAFDGLDSQLCPSQVHEDAICAATNPCQNPAVKKNFCRDLFDELDDISNDTSGNDCVQYCINYVSKGRGDCCDLPCACD